jgi:MFS family permease
MAKKLAKSEILALILVMIMMFTNTAAANMLIPSYGTIIGQFNVPQSLIFIPDSLFVLVSAIFAVIWGYYTDRVDRSKIVKGGSVLLAIGCLYTALSTNFTHLLISRIITGAAMGSVYPVGFSVISDVVPAEERASWFGFLAIFSSISNAAGNGMAAFLGPLNIFGLGWQFPFMILALIAISTIGILSFVKIPDLGSAEDDLAELNKIKDLEYGYQINRKELLKMLKKPTNKYLILNGLFTIVPGTLLIYALITTLSDTAVGMFRLLPFEIRTQTSTIMAGLVGVGYLVGNMVLAKVGDIIYKKDKRNRARLALITQIIAIPTCIIMLLNLTPLSTEFVASQNYPNPIPVGETLKYVLSTLIAIFQQYPSYILFFIFSFVGSFMGAGSVANKSAILIDANLPEHRGTATSFFQLTEQGAKSITLMLASGLLLLLNNSYQKMLIIGMLFWIPSAILWHLTSQRIDKDLEEKARILKERAQATFIDYFFELEIALDDTIQLIHDSKKKLLKNPKEAEKILDFAIDKFKRIVTQAEKRQMTDLELRTRDLMNRALMYKGEFLMLPRKNREQNLAALKEKVNQLWELSDYGKIEVLYDNAYLKICDARLRRNYNPFETVTMLQQAIDVYDRVIRLASDRIVDEDAKKMSPEEEEFQRRNYELLILAKKSQSNTQLLKNKLEQLIKTVLERGGVKEEELRTLIELNSEYGIKIKDIVVEGLEKRAAREIVKIVDESEKLFKIYDEWENNE